MFAARLIKPSAAAAALRTTSQLCARPAARSVRLFSMGPIGGVVSRGGAKVWQRPLPTAAVPRVGRVVPARLMSTSASSGVGSGASSLGGTSAIKILLGGGAAAGIIALSVYGASATNAYNAQLSDAVREQGEMMFYPQYVRDRLNKTFLSIAGGLGVTALTAFGAFSSGAIMRAMAANPMMFGIGSFVLTIGSMFGTMAAQPDSAFKYAMWALFSASVGLTLAPLCTLGGALVGQAALYTGGIVGGLSLVAANSPSDRFLSWGGPLSIGLGAVFISSFAGMIFPAAAPLMHSVWLYGGLALFSAFVLYDVSKMVSKAKVLPDGEFDHVNEGISLYLDTINIFVRIATILAGQKNRK